MSHLDDVKATVNYYDARLDKKLDTIPRLQLRMLYVIAQLLARILDRIESEGANDRRQVKRVTQEI